MHAHPEDRPLWALPVYVQVDKLSTMRVHIPGHGPQWLTVSLCPGLRMIRPGEMGPIHMPDWLRRERRIAPSRWVRKVEE